MSVPFLALPKMKGAWKLFITEEFACQLLLNMID